MAFNLDDVVASRKLARTVCAKMLKDAESQFVVYAGMMLLLMVCKSKPNLESAGGRLRMGRYALSTLTPEIAAGAH